MIVAIVWFALDPLHDGSLKIGDLVAFIEYSFHALLSFLFLANLFTMYPRTAVSSRRLKKIMDMHISIDPNENGVTETAPLLIQVRQRVRFSTTFPFRPNLEKRLPLSARPVLGNLHLCS